MSMNIYIYMYFKILIHLNIISLHNANFFKCFLYSFNVLSLESVMYQPMKEYYSIRYLYLKRIKG